ncbi:hydrolase [Rothia sp. AR01]|uniref:Hydrolase n=1 Tax=Rothia santali TaxID=2949643 RepID=A0A9X2KHQ9_9MICC|nr:hydrolase [Rothia santali]MCP3426112.1 hydrolase [Rothia santali]
MSTCEWSAPTTTVGPAAVEAELPAGAFDVIAYSLGARLAWELPGATPRVRRMVLGGISPREPFGAIDAAALREVLAGGEPADPLTGQIGAMIAAPGRDTESLIEVIRGLAAEPFDPREAAPRIPVLLVAGRDDVVAQGIEELAGLLPHGELQRVPGDHRVALTGPELRDAALDFLGRD